MALDGVRARAESTYGPAPPRRKIQEQPPAAHELTLFATRSARLSAAGVLALQRTFGNRAVTQLLTDRALQRKVGFEFEDKSWQPWRREKKKWNESDRVWPVRRKQAIHQGSNFKLEGDDTLGEDDPDIEFVTEPFEETDAGLQDLAQTLAEMTTIYGRLAANKGKLGPVKTTAKPWKYSASKFIGPGKHGLLGGPDVAADDVLVSGGTDKLQSIKMQATAGTTLAQLPTMLEYLGVAPGESGQEKAERGPARGMMYGSEDPAGNQIAALLGSAPTLARDVVNRMRNDPLLSVAERGALAHSTDKLVGFISALLIYVKQLQYPDKDYVKYRLPLLGRTDFAAMFADVPQRDVLTANNARLLKTHVIDVSNAHPMVAVKGVQQDVNLAVGSPLIKAPRTFTETGIADRPEWVPLKQLTIGEWMDGFVAGVDYLTPDNMDEFLGPSGKGVADQPRAQAVEKLESIGVSALEGAMDVRPDGDTLALFENRSIAGNELPLADAKKIALNYLRFMKQLRAGAPGAYPTQNPQ